MAFRIIVFLKTEKRFQLGFEKQLEHAEKSYTDRLFIKKMRQNHVIGQLIHSFMLKKNQLFQQILV